MIKTCLAAILLLTISCKKENSKVQSSLPTTDASDITAGMYQVRIGTQVWMKKNLDVTHYRNGDRIPKVEDPTKWAGLHKGAWCWYNNDSAIGAVYGRLYNWYAVNDPRGLAPTGWHIPSIGEWDTLSTYLGDNAGGQLKDTGTIEAGTGLWYAPNFHATNKTRFTALPAGYRYDSGRFGGIGYFAEWWTSVPAGNHFAMGEVTSSISGDLYSGFSDRHIGRSVRCIKD
jgi:uncharacterized protein (TIGR02145 family)